MANKRIRIEMSEETYDALKYFGVLRGVSLSAVINRELYIYASQTQSEFPAVRAHVLARMKMREASEKLAASMTTEPGPGDVPD